MNPSPPSSPPDQTIFAKLRHAVGRVPIPSSLRKSKWIVLMAVGLILATIFWFQRTPSNEELWAYRMGYGMGQSIRAEGGKVDQEDLAAEMGINADEQDMFADGFKDGRKGRKARYEAPKDIGQSSEPGAGGAYIEPPSLEETQPESPAGDYAINSMYGEARPKADPKQETSEE